MENLQKPVLHFLHDNFESSYKDLPSKSCQNLVVKIYKTLKNLNPSFINNIFKLKINSRDFGNKFKLNLDVPK